MFKRIQIYNIAAQWHCELQAVEAALAVNRFTECGATQESSVGWIEPRGEKHGALVEDVGGQWIAKLMTETKVIPGAVVKEEAKKCCAEIEAQTGRKPGKKEKREITEDVRNKLIAQAFTRKAVSVVWIDPTAMRLVIDAGSQSRADEVITQLVKAMDGFAVTLAATNQSPAVSMSIWLDTQETPQGFTADRDCVLQANDDSKASVRYAKHALDIEEIRGHIAAGKTPVQLAMTWNDQVSFVLTDSGALKKIAFLDAEFEAGKSHGADSGFDADVAIATGELSKLIPDLLDALGGHTQLQAG